MSQLYQPLLSTASAVGDNQETPIPLPPSVIHKFYEPIQLFSALVELMRDSAEPVSIVENINSEDVKQVYEAFLNKLSHVCDYSKGGKTVTSCAVLKNPGNLNNVDYLFAVGRQNQDELAATATFVKELLRKIGQASHDVEEQDAVRRSVLHEIVLFNRPRITIYLRRLRSDIAECLKKCEEDNDRMLARQLRSICDPASDAPSLRAPMQEYLNDCQSAIRTLIQFFSFGAGDIVFKRARENQMPGYRPCWATFLHISHRILAYPNAVKFFLLAKSKNELQPLFRSPSVSFIPSSSPIPKPIRKKSLTAEGIVGRMTRKTKIMDAFKSFVQGLQKYELDERIKEMYKKGSSGPFVHGEVLLLDWLEQNHGLDPSRFFNNWMYIGISKPMCKLCTYYFEEHQSRVGHRQSHGNLYPNWRVPDVLPSQGQQALDKRQVMVDRILQRVRKDAFDIIQHKSQLRYKTDDSNTFTAKMTLDESWTLDGSTTDADVDEISSVMGQLDFGSD